jgi:hypothetical protein
MRRLASQEKKQVGKHRENQRGDQEDEEAFQTKTRPVSA